MGFTLVEILVVLVILAITAGVTAPAFVRLTEEDETTKAGRELVWLLESARRTAVEQGQSVSTIVDPATGSYWVWMGSDSVRAGQLALESGASLLSNKDRLSWRFDARGTAHGDSVFVRTPSGGALVGVQPWTGTVYVRR